MTARNHGIDRESRKRGIAMIPEEAHFSTDERQTIEPGEPLAEVPPTMPPDVPAETIEARREASHALASIALQGKSVAHRELRSLDWFRILGLSLATLGGLSWFIFCWSIVHGQPQVIILSAVLLAFLPALTCLAAGWLVRSWWGLIAVPAVYVAISAVMWVLLVGGGPADLTFLTADFALYIVVPAVVMAAIGTLIGMFRAREVTGHLAA